MSNFDIENVSSLCREVCVINLLTPTAFKRPSLGLSVNKNMYLSYIPPFLAKLCQK
jgi:hypothetical protein